MTSWIACALSALLVLAGTVMVVRGLIGRWPRGRVRCPWCLYDLRSLVRANATPDDAPPLCPECGRRARAIKQLSRWRALWRSVGFGVALFACAATVVVTLVKPDVLITQAPLPWVLRAMPYMGKSQFQPSSTLNTRLTRATLSAGEGQLLGRSLVELLRNSKPPDDDWLCSLIISTLAPAPAVPASQISFMFVRGEVQLADLHNKLLSLGLSYPDAATLLRCCFRNNGRPRWLSFRAPPGETMYFSEYLDCVDVGDFPAYDLINEVGWKAARASAGERVEAAEWLMRVLRNPEADNRRAAADCLGALGNDARGALAHLHELALNDPDRIVQMAASTAEHSIRHAPSPRVPNR